MNFVQQVSRAVFWNYLTKISSYGLDFLLSVLLARGLGKYGFGVYSELFNFIFLFTLICSFGMDSALNTFLPKYSNEPEKASFLLRKIAIVLLLFSLIICLGIVAFSNRLGMIVHNSQIPYLLRIAVLYIFIYNFIIVAQSILISYYRTKFIFLTNTLVKIVTLVCFYLLLRLKFGLTELIYGYITISFIALIIYLRSLKEYVRIQPTSCELKPVIKFGFAAWLTKYVNYLMSRYLDIFLLGYFLVPKEAIGYYNIAFTLTMGLSYVISSGFSGVSLAAFSKLAKQNNFSGISRGWLTINKLTLLFSVPVFLFAIYYAKPLIDVLYSAAYLPTVKLFQVFGVFFLLSITIGSGLNSTVLYSIQKEQLVLYLRVLVGLLNLILDLLLIPRYQAMGAILATGLSVVLIIALEFSVVKKKFKFSYPYLFLVKIIIASAVGVAMVLVVPVSNLIFFTAKFLLFILIFVAIIYLIKPLSAEDVQLVSNINKPLYLLVNRFQRKK